MGKTIQVEVAYAGAEHQYQTRLVVPLGTTLRGVIERARLCERFSEIDLAINRVGIFGVLRDLDALVNEGDRVEVYQPLPVEPKTARRTRSRRRPR